jgi:ATP-binding cassette subfamily B protein
MTALSEPLEKREPVVELPDVLAARLPSLLNGREVVAWSEFDVNNAGRYAQQHAVLLDEALLVLHADGRSEEYPLSGFREAHVLEGLGADRLQLVRDGAPPVELRYSRRFRRDMTRLRRRIERRLPSDKPDEERPAWLERVERLAEQQERCPKCREIIPAYADGVCPSCLRKRQILWRLLEVARPYRWTIRAALLLTLVNAAIGAMPGLIQKNLVDTALNEQSASHLSSEQRLWNLGYWAGAFVLVILVGEFIGGVRMALLSTVGTSVTRDLRHRIYAHLHDLSLRFFAKRRTGSLITRVTSDTDRLWDFVVFGSVNFIRDILLIIAIVVIMLALNWKLALVALAPLPLVTALTWWRGRTMHRMFGRLWTYWSRLGAVVGDAIGGVRVVKAFAAEQQEVSRFDRRNIEYTINEQQVNRTWWQLQPIVSGTMRLGMLLVWVVGGYLVITDPSAGNTLGTLVAFTFYVGQFYGPINELANSSRMVTRAASSAQRVFEVLDTPPEIYNRGDALRPDRMVGRVELRNVSFSYEGAQPALRDVSVVIEPGQMVGLCGQSGAGKSTLVNLICRFYDATDGQVIIDDHDVRDYDIQWLRRNVGVVLQDPYLFHGTIAENIRYGDETATDEDIIRAARAANAHDFIVGLPDGYDTLVGERGQSLSGGERQRISIARAILHNPRILILDEATSSVDTETEKQIQQALDRLVAGRTTIAIAHRLSTLRAAHRLIVLDKGRIVETGTHDELLAREDGVYAKLHRTQMEMNAAVALR